MKKIALVLALIMVFASVLTACGEKESGGISINKDAQTTSDTQIVSGLSGESYTLSNNITKVVSLSPAASMIIDNLGGSSKLTAVDKTSADYVSVSSTVDASGAAGLSPEVIFVDEADKAEKYIYSVLDHDVNYQQLINHIKDNPEYIKQQEAFHKKNLMRKEYYHIFYELPELAPKSFSAYSRMKNAQTKNFLKLKEQAIKHGISIS